MTPSTPVIPLIHALDHTLDRVMQEGVENRYTRHARLNDKLLRWGKQKGFELFPLAEYASKTLACFRNSLKIDVAGFLTALKQNKKFLINGGYGKIKGETLRISNMGEETDATMQELFEAMDETLPEFMPS